MGIDFSNYANLIGKLDKAKSVEGDLTKIDTKKELNLFVTGFDAIEKKAESEGATKEELDTLELTMKDSLTKIMDTDLAEKAGQKTEQGEVVFGDSDDILSEMMDILAQSPIEGSDGIDMAKLKEYNKIAVETEPLLVMDGLRDFGFDEELIDILVDQSPETINYVSNAIKDGSANTISSFAVAADEYANDTKDMDILGYIRYQYQQ